VFGVRCSVFDVRCSVRRPYDASLFVIVPMSTENRKPKTESRKPKTENRKPKTENRKPMSLVLKNPHAVLAALEMRPADVVEIRLGAGRPGGAWEEVAERAAALRVSLVQGARATSGGGRRAKRGGGDEGRRTAGAEAVVRPRGDVALGELFDTSSLAAGEFGVWLALDHVQDPHNVGAIVRTAAFFGVRGVVVTRDRSAPLNGVVYDVASGGMEYVPFSEQTNLARTLEAAKEARLWVLGTSEHAEADLSTIERDRHWLVVLGNEEKGVRRLTGEHCDVLCRITSRGGVGSLNVSVANGVVLGRLLG
jgi:23S rRNA (guanosine2251-2'-O)-methyltransferase